MIHSCYLLNLLGTARTCLAFILFGALIQASFAEDRPNILLIVIDDLNDYVGCLGGHPNAYTPHIDALAEEGILFTNAHCNSPVCNPSRASIWTGLRPTTTGITTNHSGWFRDHPDFRDLITLPKALGNSGYTTIGLGKLFHLGHGNQTWPDWQQHRRYGYGPRLNTHMSYREGDGLSDWGTPPAGKGIRRGPQPSRVDMASFDEDIARRVSEVLEDDHDRPFFLAAGFYRPHTPLYAPKRWFDHFPLDKVDLPAVKMGDNDDLPYFGSKPRREVDIEAPGLWQHDWVIENEQWHRIVRAYLASTSYVDEQVGKVVQAWKKSPHFEKTYLVLCSDHGWHLGEKEHWGKAALLEQTTRIPLIIAGPGINGGQTCKKPVELLSLYPTFLDWTRVEPPHALEGSSLLPLVDDPQSDSPHVALTTFSEHHALRTERYRYIRYVDGSEELYDHDSDPNEWVNLALDNHPELSNLRPLLDKILTQP
ncbi:MAG: sulfatase [Verrucomicrobiota bacterium]